jgi:hypothetical protein
MFGAGFMACTSTAKYMHDLTCPSIVVWRWRWLPPLVADMPHAATSPGEKRIKVMRLSGPSRSCSDWRSRDEVVCPSRVPLAVSSASRSTARLMEAGARLEDQARVLLCGPPGCGKSTATRFLAQALDAVLVVGFDPIRVGAERLMAVIDNARLSSDEWVVIVVEEVDCALSRIEPHGARVSDDEPGDDGGGDDLDDPDSTRRRRQGPASARGPPASCALDKASWNGMMDMLQFHTRVALVMTSNKTLEELDAIDALRGGGALLREGRVTQRIAMSE